MIKSGCAFLAIILSVLSSAHATSIFEDGFEPLASSCSDVVASTILADERNSDSATSSCNAVPIFVDQACGEPIIVEITALGRGTNGDHSFFFDSSCSDEITALGELPGGSTTIYYAPPLNYASYSMGSSAVNAPGVSVTARAKTSPSGAFGAAGTTLFSVASTDNDLSTVTVSAPNCQEDETCSITMTVSDFDPEDTHSIEVLSVFYSPPNEALRHNAIPVVAGQMFALSASGLVFTYEALSNTCPSSRLVMQFSATDTPPASSGIAPKTRGFEEVFVSLASVDDAPTADAALSVFQYVGSAETIPAGASVMLNLPVTQRDLLCLRDQYQIIFPTLPDPAVGVLKFNDGGSPALVVANQPINCGLGSCRDQISFELTSAQPTNQVIATFNYTARDNTVAQLSSSALVTIRTAARNVPLLEPTHSHSFNYAEGSTGSVMVVKIRQPENIRYADMHLAVWSYPMITVAASPNDLTHTSGVVFATSADRIDSNGELYHPRDTLLSPGVIEVPKVRYRPVSDCSALDICEFHIAVRACNAGEVSDPAAPCDPNYAGTSSFTISVQPTSNGWNSRPGFEFQNQLTVTNDKLDAGATFVSFNAGLDSMGNEVCPDPSGGPFELYNADWSPHAAALSTDLHYCTQDSPFRLFNLGMVNDEIAASSWRLDVTVFWDFGGGYFQDPTTTVALTPEGVTNAPGVTTSFAGGVLSISHTNLLTLRQAAYYGFDIGVESFEIPAVVRVELFADDIPTSEPVYVEVYKSDFPLTNAPTVPFPTGN